MGMRAEVKAYTDADTASWQLRVDGIIIAHTTNTIIRDLYQRIVDSINGVTQPDTTELPHAHVDPKWTAMLG